MSVHLLSDEELTREMASWGWKRVPSSQGWAINPEIAPYWQRWQGEGLLDWIELPAGMPVRLVRQIIQSQHYLPQNANALRGYSS